MLCLRPVAYLSSHITKTTQCNADHYDDVHVDEDYHNHGDYNDMEL